MAEVRKLRIGFVGCGFMGQKAHLRNYVTLTDECEVVAVAEPREKQRHLVATRYGIKEEYKDHLDLLKNAKVDAVVAAQPYSHHAAIIPDILNAKVPVFTEKPVAFSIEAGQMLADTADSNGTLYMVGYHKRSDPAIEYAKAKIDAWKASGEMGKMRLVRISMPPGDWVFNGGNGALGVAGEQYPPIKNEEWPDYFGNMDKMKEYNAFVNYYIHQVNLMRFMFGEDYKVTFADKTGVLLATESQSGVCGTLEMAAYSNSKDWQESVFVTFERGWIKVDLPAPLASQRAGTVTFMVDNGGEAMTCSPTMPSVHAMRNQAKNYLAAVRGDRKAPCEAREAVLDLKVAKDYVIKRYGG